MKVSESTETLQTTICAKKSYYEKLQKYKPEVHL